MKKIDIHHHLIEEKGYCGQLLKTLDECDIEKCGLIGLGPLFKGMFVKGEPDGSCADNATVSRVVKEHPDRFFGLYYIRLGKDSEKEVDRAFEHGFKGLKFTIPTHAYSHEEFFPVYEKAAKYDLPCLFHTGILTLPVPLPQERINSFNMGVIHLEPIAQAFPDLKIIIAHCGMQDYLTALTMIRILPNVYTDLSGTIPGWRANLSEADWKRLLWFEHAHQKILFGSDVHCGEISDSIKEYEKIFAAAGWDEKKLQAVFYDNATIFE